MRISPEEAVSLELWDCLIKASDAIEQGKVISALRYYRSVMPNLVIDNTPRWSAINADYTVPSLNGLCRLLWGYYTFTQTWQAWNYIAIPIFERSALLSLPLAERLTLLAIHGWAMIRRYPLISIIREQEAALEMSRFDNDLNWQNAHHHLILCYAYTLAFEENRALKHGLEAQHIFADLGSVYGAMRTYEMMGTAYYTAWKYDEALAYYARLEVLINQTGNEAAPMHPYYGQGWAYLGLKSYDEALRYFRIGQEMKMQHDLLYDAARCLYAEGYTRFRQGDFVGAIECHQTALKTFCDDDHYLLNLYNFGQGSRSIPMMATCLHNLALVYEYQGRFRKAFEEEKRAVEWQKQLDDPGQSADFLRRAIYLSIRSGKWNYTMGYLVAYFRLRLKYRVPGFRF